MKTHLISPGEDGEVFVVKAGPKYELIATNPIGEVLVSTRLFPKA
jgi:hypothetical protein